MANSLPGYDQWLERPYQDAAEDSDSFVTWAEEMGWDLDDPIQTAQAARGYDSWLQDQYEAKLQDDYEAAMERRYEEAQEREWDDRY